MAATPRLKVFNPQGEYVAACKYAEDAAAILSNYGDGATLRMSHSKDSTVWIEGTTGCAGDSYDDVRIAVDQYDAKLKARFNAALGRKEPA